MNRRLFLGSAFTAIALAACGTQPARPPTAAPPALPTAVPPTALVPTTAPPAATTPTAGASAGMTVVQAGGAGNLGDAGLILAQSAGYFAQEGISTELVHIDTAAKAVPSLAAGQLDLANGGLNPGLFNAMARGIPIRVVASSSEQKPGANGLFLVLRKDVMDGGKVKTYANLKGLKLGEVGKGTSQEYFAGRALEAGGLTFKDVTLEVLDTSANTITSLANKAIDVAVLGEPQLTAAVDMGVAVKWKPASDVLSDMQYFVLQASPQFQTRRDLATRWLTAYLRGVRDYNDAFFKNQHRAETVRQLINFLPIKDPKTYDEMSYSAIDPDGNVNATSLENQMRWYVSAGEMQEPVDVSKVIDLSFVQAAAAKLGPYQ